MDTVSAIAKVRFASAKPQRIGIHGEGELVTELLCLEPGQEIRVDRGQWRYYVVSGTVTVVSGDERCELTMGHLAATSPGERHRIANTGPQRAICLAFGSRD